MSILNNINLLGDKCIHTFVLSNLQNFQMSSLASSQANNSHSKGWWRKLHVKPKKGDLGCSSAIEELEKAVIGTRTYVALRQDYN